MTLSWALLVEKRSGNSMLARNNENKGIRIFELQNSVASTQGIWKSDQQEKRL